jgi:hypothetical protein
MLPLWLQNWIDQNVASTHTANQALQAHWFDAGIRQMIVLLLCWLVAFISSLMWLNRVFNDTSTRQSGGLMRWLGFLALPLSFSLLSLFLLLLVVGNQIVVGTLLSSCVSPS